MNELDGLKRIGFVVAVEADLAIKKYKCEVKSKDDVWIARSEDSIIFVIQCGAGEIAAAAATQLLIDKFDVDVIANYGVVGSLLTELPSGYPCLVKSAIHYDRDTSRVDHIEKMRYAEHPSAELYASEELIAKANTIFPSLSARRCASGDKFVDGFFKKSILRRRTHADICDMESAAIIFVSKKNNTPCVLVKAVADEAKGGAKEYTEEKDSAAQFALDLLDSILEI